MTNSAGVPVYAYAVIDEVVARLAAMTAGERRQVAAKLAQQAPDVAESMANELFDYVYMGPPPGMVIGGDFVNPQFARNRVTFCANRLTFRRGGSSTLKFRAFRKLAGEGA